jgi:hypothetical protein
MVSGEMSPESHIELPIETCHIEGGIDAWKKASGPAVRLG